MSYDGPGFYAWCDADIRLASFVATLYALAVPDGKWTVTVEAMRQADDLSRHSASMGDIIALVRSAYGPTTLANVRFNALLPSGRSRYSPMRCIGEERRRLYFDAPISASTGEHKDIFPTSLKIPVPHPAHSINAEAAIAAMQIHDDCESILLGICAPDANKRVSNGLCTGASGHPTSLEAAATYHADGRAARDLALAWVHLHDGDKVGYALGLSLSELTARVEAAPRAARVGVASKLDRVDEHLHSDWCLRKDKEGRPTRAEATRHGPRSLLPGDAPLTREQVLAALATPPDMLLQALEAAAVPSDEWRIANAQAVELIEAQKQRAPTCKVKVSTGKHIRFIEQHAPYHVRRLPNGGVMLATHPYRTLWPLWQDALFLLGITP
jgi:hypothetical protein